MQASTVSTAVHVGCSGWVYRHWRGLLLSRRPAAEALVRTLCRGIRHGRDQRQLLPPAPGLDLRRLAREGAAGLSLCGQGQPLPHPHEEARSGCEEEIEKFIALARPLEHDARPDPLPAAAEPPQRPRAARGISSSSCPATSSMSSSSATPAGTTRRSSRCSIATASASSPTTSRASNRRAGRAAAPPTSASTAPAANIGGAIRTRRCSNGPTGASSRRARAEASGAISTTTSTATRSRMRGR